ncbi:MAG: aldehyde dehydrogenase family protein [Bacteroidetes bacterium]|nr:MAG: aldehyde dehydrogenase family protein [Bacteroidota bacterium]
MDLRRSVENGETISYEFRRKQLLLLREAILRYEDEIYDALFQDLRKSREEAYATEIGIVLMEIRHILNNLHKWTRAESVKTNLLNFPSSAKIIRDPLGVVLIIAPWNYPIQLLLMPLVGAIAGGNTVVLKPSELAPACAGLMEKMIKEIFSNNHVAIICGDGAEVIPCLMRKFRFDHVFYTGSTAVGASIYQLAAKQLTPVTLELGGKSPAIIEKDANLEVAARRIALGKFLNAGQTCVAPDYLLVHVSVREKFLEQLKKSVADFFGKNAFTSSSYGRIINSKRFDTLVEYLSAGEVVYGGNHNREELYISPTIMENICPDSTLMSDEIFGPILPVFYYECIEEAAILILKNPTPLALYVFTSNKETEEKWMSRFRFGGGCINNTVWHLSNHHLPFGGIGTSGFGAYHGKHSINRFTHAKPILKTPNWFDPSIKYPPFEGKLKWFKKMIR